MTKIINSTIGRDYPDIASWLADTDDDLVSSDQTHSARAPSDHRDDEPPKEIGRQP